MTTTLVLLGLFLAMQVSMFFMYRRERTALLRQCAQLRARAERSEHHRELSLTSLSSARREAEELQFQLDDARREVVLYRDRADTITMPVMKAPPERKK